MCCNFNKAKSPNKDLSVFQEYFAFLHESMLSEPPQQSCSQAMTQRRNYIYWTGECFHPGEPVWVYNHYSFISKNPAPWASLSKDLNGSKLARCCNIEKLWGKRFTFICFFKFCPDSSAQWPSLCVLILIDILLMRHWNQLFFKILQFLLEPNTFFTAKY